MAEEKNKSEAEDTNKKQQHKAAAPGAEKKTKPADEDGKKGPQTQAEGPAGAAAPGAAPAAKPAKAKTARSVPSGVAHINATFNNTQVAITDLKGSVLAWSSAGRMGFKGTRKSTAYAATVVAQEVAKLVAPYRMQEIEVRVQGPGAGRESAIRALQSAGLTINLIKDVTPMPHNGCRSRKRRRV